MRYSVATLLVHGLLMLSAAAAQAADPISILKSDASLKDKQEACRQLSIRGTEDAVPVLAPLLTDEALSHMARYALEPMPFPEAGNALRDALGKTSGRLEVGIVSSLAVRKDELAVPQLIKLLRDRDADVAQASARALGTIGNTKAEKALLRAIAQSKLEPGLRTALCDGLLSIAEERAQEKQPDVAVRIYEHLGRVPNAAPDIRAAALRGAALNLSSDDDVRRLVDRMLRDDDEKIFAAALRVCRESERHAVTTAVLASNLPKAPSARKVQILDVFGSGDGDFAGPEALTLANDADSKVRVAALRAVTRMNYDPALKVLAQLATSDDETLAEVAKRSLAYFPGSARYVEIEGLLKSDQAKSRRIAIELIGQGGLDEPVALLMNTAETDSDEGVRVAALESLRDHAGIEELPRLLDKLLKSQSQPEIHAAESALTALCARQVATPGNIVILKAVYGDLPGGPSANVVEQVSRIVSSGARSVDATNANFGEPAPNVVKKLMIDYTDNGTPASKTVNEGESLKLSAAIAPPIIVDAFCDALKSSKGDAKLAMLRLLGATGSQKAFGVVRGAASTGETKDTALQVLCNWPTSDALPTVMELAKASPDKTIREAALRGAIRLLGQNRDTPAKTLGHFSTLMDQARTPDDKRLILSGLTQLSHVGALELALAQFGDASVKPEAAQAALAISKNLGNSAREDKVFFNGTDLTGWLGNTTFWRVEDNAIVGQSKDATAQNELLWSEASVSDFYLVAEIMIEPNTGNGGLQFRATMADARGYRAGIGQGAWGRLARAPGDEKLDWTDEAENAVKPGQWNRYEILAVGPAVWIAINGKLGAVYLETEMTTKRTGQIAIQVHSGPPQTVRCRIQRLVLDPKVSMAGLSANDLIGALRVSKK